MYLLLFPQVSSTEWRWTGGASPMLQLWLWADLWAIKEKVFIHCAVKGTCADDRQLYLS